MEAAFNGETACLSALIQAKANVDHQDNVRWSADVVWVPGCNVDDLALESRWGQRRHCESRI